MRIFKNKYGAVRSGWKIALTLILMFALMNVVSIFCRDNTWDSSISKR